MVMTFRQIYIGATVLVGGLLVGACSEEVPFNAPTEEETSSEAQFLVKTVGNGSVDLSTRANAVDLNDFRNNFPLGYDFIEGKSRIRVCSVTRNGDDPNRVPEMDIPFDNMTTHPTGYHEYICQKRIEYSEYSIFNTYKPEGGTEAVPLKWDELDENGNVKPNTGNILKTDVGGGYYMYAAMFPYLYKPVEESTQDRRMVNEDQTYKDTDKANFGHYAANLLMNDIRLCYKMFGRDKFREPIRLDFYHTLCLLVVNVEIPIFNPEDGTGFEIKDILQTKEMTLNEVYRCFKPNYTKGYDENDYVEVSPTDVEESKREYGTIRMFHTPNFTVPNNTAEPSDEPFKETDAYWERAVDHTGKSSHVAWTQFCAILPPQQLEKAYADFNIGTKKYRCYLSGNPSIPLQQTYVTTVTLYIPREESDPVIIGAHLKDWEKHRTPIIPLQ